MRQKHLVEDLQGVSRLPALPFGNVWALRQIHQKCLDILSGPLPQVFIWHEIDKGLDPFHVIHQKVRTYPVLFGGPPVGLPELLLLFKFGRVVVIVHDKPFIS